MMSANYLDNNNDNYDFGKRKKSRQAVVVLLLVLSTGVVFFGLLQIINRINSPFILDEAMIASLPSTEEVLGDYTGSLNADTDGDGLSDYDELHLYKTSPYLGDTDSDGIFDKDEIDRGTDPKCPEGQNCLEENYFVEEKIGSDLLAIPNNDSGLTNLNSSEEFTDEKLREVLAGQVDAQVLRTLLLEGGIEQAVLDEISDEELLASYQEALNKQNE